MKFVMLHKPTLPLVGNPDIESQEQRISGHLQTCVSSDGRTLLLAGGNRRIPGSVSARVLFGRARFHPGFAGAPF